MAKKKAKKRSVPKAIYAFLNDPWREEEEEYLDIAIGYGAKPKVTSSQETCEFGEKHTVKDVQAPADFQFFSEGLCQDGFLKATGIRLRRGEVVKLSVTVVE